ncbi:MAG: UbiA family prenyltransferase [Candidatus Hecatellaceae archaeon]
MKAGVYLRLMRPVNCVMMGVAVLIGEFIALKGSLNPYASLLGFLTAFTLAGGSMAANDYFDREVDTVNEPDRPIPSGQVTPGKALAFSALLGALGLAFAFLSWRFFQGLFAPLVAGISFALALGYNGWGKRFGLPGNLMVSACVAVPFLYGAFMVGVLPSLLLAFFAALAFLSNTGREIVKGIADMAGDRLRRIETLALKYGPRPAAWAAAAFYLSAVVLSVIPPVLGLVSAYYVPPVALSCLGFAYTSLKILGRPEVKEARGLKRLSLLWMLLGLAGFMAGAVGEPLIS